MIHSAPASCRFEAAIVSHDGKTSLAPKGFALLDDALTYAQQSGRDSVRPWVRLLEPSAWGSFLVIAGRKLDAAEPRGSALLHLDAQERAQLDAWQYLEPGIRCLLDHIDLCNNGYARLDCLPAPLRASLPAAVAGGHVQLGHDVVHRPGLRIEQGPAQAPARRVLHDDADYEAAILARQSRHLADL